MTVSSKQQPLTPALKQKIVNFNYNSAVFYKNNPNYFNQPNHLSPSKCFLGAFYDQKHNNVVSYTVADAQKSFGKIVKLSGAKMFNKEMTSAAIQNTVHTRIQQALNTTINCRGNVDGVRRELRSEQANYFANFKPKYKPKQKLPMGVTKKQLESDKKRYGKTIKSLVRQDLIKQPEESSKDFNKRADVRTEKYIIYGEQNKKHYKSIFWRIEHQLSKDVDQRRNDKDLNKAALAEQPVENLDLSDNDNNPNWQNDYKNQIKDLTQSMFSKNPEISDQEHQQSINQKTNSLINKVIKGSNKWLSSLKRQVTPQEKDNSLKRGYQMMVNSLEQQLDPYKDEDQTIERDAQEQKEQAPEHKGYQIKDNDLNNDDLAF